MSKRFQRHFFTLDGVNSADFGVYIAQSNMFDGPEHDDNTVEIPGRNGALVFSNGRYHNRQGSLSCYMPKDMQTNVDGFRAFLSTKYGYVRYEDTIHPGEFLHARFKGGFALESSDRVGAAFDLSFDCKPQRFLKLGELSVTFTSAGTLRNPTRYDARPLVRCYGTSGTVTINGTAVTVTGLSSYVDLDCDLMESYEGATSRNSTTTLTNGKFPVLSPGNNAVSFSGFSYVVITPRWWTL